MIQQLQQIFRSTIKSLEVLYVIEDAKPCARIMVFEDDLGKAVRFLDEKKISAAVSGFKALKQAEQSEFYSDKSIKIPKNDPRKGYFFVYLSKNREVAEKARLAEENSNHLELGSLLGYPECCSTFFEKNFDEKRTDLTLNALQNSDGFEFQFYTNIAARHFDTSLLSHFPHSFGCEPSINIAKGNFKIIQKHSGLAAIFSGILKRAVVYTMEEGVFLLKCHERINNRIVYGDILTTAKSKLYYLLSSNGELEIFGKNSFVVNDAKIEGKSYGVMFFI